MIPALRNCPKTWTKEYEGYLMSSYITNQRSTFECVDETPEGINGKYWEKVIPKTHRKLREGNS